ncbi:hypothetical protein ACGF5C_29040 [Micromonospora sp. NPDC047620]|uniref:hypothetical protein n=1 Tax=Micromonospora sp. NPDC047620 TaxID=3364251 RepID=UPI00371BCEA2
MRARAAALLAALIVGVAAPVPTAPAVAATPVPLVDSYFDWLVASYDGVRNGLRRDVEHVYGNQLVVAGHTCTAASPCTIGGPQQSTAACTALQFISVYLDQRVAYEQRSLSSVETGLIDEFASAVLAHRLTKNPDAPKIFDDAVASTPDGQIRYFTSFGNAACGEALLAAHQATGASGYLDAATGIGEFLLRMQDPRAYYLTYGVHPFVDGIGQPTTPPGGYVDQISSWSNLYSTISTWNLTAGYQRLQQANRQDALYAPLDRSLAAMFLPAQDTNDLDGDSDTTEYLCKGTRGTLPVAHNGLGILKAVGHPGTR